MLNGMIELLHMILDYTDILLQYTAELLSTIFAYQSNIQVTHIGVVCQYVSFMDKGIINLSLGLKKYMFMCAPRVWLQCSLFCLGEYGTGRCFEDTN